jgi:hypothetical protein
LRLTGAAIMGATVYLGGVIASAGADRILAVPSYLKMLYVLSLILFASKVWLLNKRLNDNDAHPDVERYRSALATDAWLSSITLAIAVLVLLNIQGFPAWAQRLISTVFPSVASWAKPLLAQLVSTAVSGIVGNAAYAFVRRLFTRKRRKLRRSPRDRQR